jgi:hypothetical protein
MSFALLLLGSKRVKIFDEGIICFESRVATPERVSPSHRRDGGGGGIGGMDLEGMGMMFDKCFVIMMITLVKSSCLITIICHILIITS